MKRLIPTAVVGFGVLMLMFRGFETARDPAQNATNATSFDVVDKTLTTTTGGASEIIPFAFLAAGVAIILYAAA